MEATTIVICVVIALVAVAAGLAAKAQGRKHPMTFEEKLNQSSPAEVWEEYYEFYWHWANSLQNSIALNYPGGVVLYMDHVYINFDLFSCLLDGTFVTFRGE